MLTKPPASPFNQEKALVRASSVITNLRVDLHSKFSSDYRLPVDCSQDVKILTAGCWLSRHMLMLGSALSIVRPRSRLWSCY